MGDSSELIRRNPSVSQAQASISLDERPSVDKYLGNLGEPLQVFQVFTGSHLTKSQTHRWDLEGSLEAVDLTSY